MRISTPVFVAAVMLAALSFGAAHADTSTGASPLNLQVAALFITVISILTMKRCRDDASANRTSGQKGMRWSAYV